MTKLILFWLLASVPLTTVSFAETQQGKIPQIGFLSGASAENDKRRLAAFHQGLRELGYREGKNIAIEYRHAAGKFEALSDLAAELVRLNVDVIVVSGTPAARAAKQATTTIPIVIGNAGDPVGIGLVASLARPGGNITGLSGFTVGVITKHLELLKDIVPSASRVAVLLNPNNPLHLLHVKETGSTAPGNRRNTALPGGKGT